MTVHLPDFLAWKQSKNGDNHHIEPGNKTSLAHSGILNTDLLEGRSPKECKTGKYRKLPKGWIEFCGTTLFFSQEK